MVGGWRELTTQDLYFGIQAVIQLLVGVGVVWSAWWLGGMVKRALDAQSAVVQDVERNSKIMQQVIDFFDPEAQLKRERAYKERLDRNLKALEDEMSATRQELTTTRIWLSGLVSQLVSQYEEANTMLKEANLLVVESHTQLEAHNQDLERVRTSS